MTSASFRTQNESSVSKVPGSCSVGLARMFLGTALGRLDTADLDRTPLRKLAVWIFSLGAIDALAARLALDPGASRALAVEFFADFYALDPSVATTWVRRLRQLGETVHWRHAREVGDETMRRWLDGSDRDCQRQLTSLLEEPSSASAARLAVRLTELEGPAAHETGRRAARTQERKARPHPFASLLGTR